MKLSNNDLKKIFQESKIPEPSESAKKLTVQRAVEAFEKKSYTAEKKFKGFFEFLRHMGEVLQSKLTMKGEPIMTRTSLATISVAVIAVGVFLTIGSGIHFSPIRDKFLNKTPLDGTIESLTEREEVVSKEKKVPTTNETIAVTGDKHTGSQALTAPEPEQIEKKQFAYKTTPKPQAPLTSSRLDGTFRAGSYDRSMAEGMAPRVARRMEQQQVYKAPVLEEPAGRPYQEIGRDRFTEFKTNRVNIVTEQPVSTFSIDVDTASYAFVRRQLNSGVLPQKNAVRIEEMINYFNYDYPLPQDKSTPFKPTVAVYPTPWNSNTKILHVGIKGYDIAPEKKPVSNLVFLIDVSGSMNSPDKLPLLKNSFSMLVDSLSPEDTVAIVVYAGAAGTVLEPTKVKEKGKIVVALDRLQAGGSTAGGAGINLAYSLAEMNLNKDGVNRVILATDGDFNVGITNRAELKSYIERKRKTGIFLSVLGFGQGNYNDALMQDLAQNGNGTAAYIDNLNEARKVLVDEANGTLFPIAKDVKIQVEFNPAKVHDYRLIGYETRMLNREDFNNDQVDAGEVGSGHSVTALYEITPVESREKLVDPLRYQPETKKIESPASEYAFVKIRYKLPNEETSRLITKPVGIDVEYDTISKTPVDLRFAASVAAFGQILRNDPYTKEFTYDDVIKLAEPARGRDMFGYRTEFINLVRLAKSARGM